MLLLLGLLLLLLQLPLFSLPPAEPNIQEISALPT